MADKSKQQTAEKPNEIKSKISNYGVRSIVATVIVLLSIGLAFYFWQDAREARQQTPASIEARNQEESSRVISSLSDILILNDDNEPTVAKIENPDVLRDANEDFYKNAQQGDYLVLYPQRAIIYREVENKIINIAPIINTSDIQVAPEDTEEPTN